MSTMNISLPDAMKSFVDEQVTNRGYGTSSEYLRDLIRRDQDRQHLRGLLLAGAAAPVVQEATPEYFNALRQQVRAKADAPAKPVRGARKSA
ncbi:MAG: type II toxin-antitoxin system ParD family antitoxin [Hydrogenophaga sp.]|nr:type II toxin-antitoxin system ParD family antitoxin [Hydrogenophaga sp.]